MRTLFLWDALQSEQRGVRTLFLRVARQIESALAIARTSNRCVLYPGLPSFEGHELAAAQMPGGFGGMMSLRVRPAARPGDEEGVAAVPPLDAGPEGAMALAAAVKVFTRATSLGGVESLIEHRASIEGANSPVPQDLLRLS
ncbi:hypothetical protein T484DRAFT_1765023, partial [Baffinella frigidus]